MSALEQMPIGAILLIAAATVYANQKGVPVRDALQESLKNPWGCMVCSSTDNVDDSEDSLPTSFEDKSSKSGISSTCPTLLAEGSGVVAVR